MFHVEHFKKSILVFFIFIALLTIIKPDLYILFIKSLQEREFYLNVSRGTFSTHPFLGLGAGQFVLSLFQTYTVEFWKLQPVHNVFLLVLNELGLFILTGFVVFLFKLFHVEQFKTKNSPLNKTMPRIIPYFKAILVGFIFIMLFDHYLWDIQQGQIFLWISFGLVTSNFNDNI